MAGLVETKINLSLQMLKLLQDQACQQNSMELTSNTILSSHKAPDQICLASFFLADQVISSTQKIEPFYFK